MRLHLLHDFCPACFRASDKPNCFTEIRIEDSRVDKVQMFHAMVNKNGLRLLDFSRCGPLCIKRAETCHINCLVCGKPVIFRSDEDFDLWFAHEGADRDSKNLLKKIAHRNGAKVTSRWPTPVHARCAHLAPRCGCWIPKDAAFCSIHHGAVKKDTVSRWKQMMDSDPEDEIMPVSQPKSTAALPAPTWASLIVKMKPDAPKGALKKKAAIKAKAVSVAEEQREDWYATQAVPTKHGLFDIRFHGYWMSRSRGLFYRFPDGREVPATGVDCFE